MPRESESINDGGGVHLERERLPTVMAFLIFGTFAYALDTLVYVVAQDILAGTFIQTSVVFIVNIGPPFLVSLIAPYFMQKIPYFARITAFCLSDISGCLLLAMAKQVHWKLIGVGLCSFATAVSALTFTALTSFYQEVTLTAYSAGTGVGSVIAPLYYTVMTTWACVSPKITIACMAPVLLLIMVAYYVMDKKQLTSPNPPTDKHGGVAYTALKIEEDGCDNSQNTENGSLSRGEKFLVISQMLPDLIPVFITWFSEYLIMDAVITTLAFSNAPFYPRDHYQYYIFTIMGSKTLALSYLVVLSYIKAEWVEKVKFPYLWILAIIEVMHLLFFILAAWYRFLPNVWIVLLLSFTCGLDSGVCFVNALTFFRDSFEGRYQEFVMGYTALPFVVGVFVASLLGLQTEPLLLEHCMMSVNNTDLCLTRSKNHDRFTLFCSTQS